MRALCRFLEECETNAAVARLTINEEVDDIEALGAAPGREGHETQAGADEAPLVLGDDDVDQIGIGVEDRTGQLGDGTRPGLAREPLYQEGDCVRLFAAHRPRRDHCFYPWPLVC